MSPRRAIPTSLLCLGLLASCKADPAPSPPLPSAASIGTVAATVSSGAPLPSPADAALPAEAPPTLALRASCPHDVCPLGHLVPDEVRPALSDAAPVVVWEQDLGERASVSFPRDELVELSGVVLDGALDVTPIESPNARTVGERWSAFRAPGGGVTLTSPGGRPLRVALVVATVDATGLGAHLAQRDRPGAPPSWVWSARKKPLETASFSSAPVLSWGGGAYHARLAWEGTGDDRPAAALDLVIFGKDAPIAEHAHEKEWEALAILGGEGTLVKRKSLQVEEPAAVKPGAYVSIPKAMRHSYQPGGTARLTAIQVYAPAGPEQRFKKLAGK